MERSINTVALERSLAAEAWQLNLAPERESGIRLSVAEAPARVIWGRTRWRFGECLVATSAQGICGFDIAPATGSAAAFLSSWSAAEVLRDDAAAAYVLRCAFDQVAAGEQLSLHVQGTTFQILVWRALLRIRSGQIMTYGQVAAAIGRPGAARAVGSAAGANLIAGFIPCHRLMPASGGVGAYRWGTRLKRAMLAAERESGSICATLAA